MALAAALLAVNAVRAGIVFEEDFETPDVANFLTITAGNALVTASHTWSVTQNSVDLFKDAARPEAAAYDGTQAVDLTGSPGAGVMEVNFTTTPGVAYELTFHYSHNANIGNAVARAQVQVFGLDTLLEDTVEHDPQLFSLHEFRIYTGLLTADAPHAVLRFTSLNDGIAGVVIDAISIITAEELIGDLNRDGFVGLADLDIILGNWNQNVTPGSLIDGDPSGDGFVGLADLDTVLGNWNAGAPPYVQPTTAPNVPEPGAVAFIAACGLISRRRTRVRA